MILFCAVFLSSELYFISLCFTTCAGMCKIHCLSLGYMCVIIRNNVVRGRELDESGSGKVNGVLLFLFLCLFHSFISLNVQGQGWLKAQLDSVMEQCYQDVIFLSLICAACSQQLSLY